ncbi:MAG: serine protease Do [Actinomycetota bacterium]|jgi:S1-C subfamily serine protease|nr:serine protease Do [Actinomycetota bacterium]
MCPEESGGDGTPEPDDVPSGPRPNPLDRPWVHPTELSSFVASPDAPTYEARPREWAIGIGSAVAAIIATVLVLVAFGALGGRNRSPLPPPVVTGPNDVIDYAVAKRVGAVIAPSVVTVRVGGDATKAAGSGVVVQSDRVMTAAHLLTGATKVDIVTPDGRQLGAKVIGVDPQTDLALLEVSGGGLRVATVSAAGSPQVGETVVAVSAVRGTGSKLGIDIVSDRNVLAATGTGIDVAGLVQTGLTVTPDMAGGALVDQHGSVVGILTYALGAAPNGLAIPSSAVRDVADQFDSSGKVSHGWMGVWCSKDDADLPEGGATVAKVLPGSPAAAAGLAANDVITRAGGARVSGRADLVAASRALRPQDPLEVQYVRDGKPKTITVTLGAGDPQVMATYAPDMG